MAEKKSAVIPWLKPQETEEETPKTSSFGSIFDNISAWGNAAYANTRELGMGKDIKNTFDKLYNRQYSDSDEKAQLIADLDRLQAERDQYRNDFQENQEILNQNDSYLKDFTEIGGTLQGIGTQVRDTAIGAGLGAIGGSVVPVAGTASGAMTGARIGNFIGSIDQAVQDADMNAVDAWERVLQEGGTPDQAEQAYKDAFWANMPTEAMDIISSMYMGGKLLGGTGKILNRALGGKLAGTLASGVNKVARFDLPAKLGTYVANKSGQAWLGQGVGVGLGMLGNAAEEGIQEPWQDYATERAVDIQRRQYDPTHEGIRDFSVFGDGGLLDYYTTPEGMNTAIKAAKMGAAFGGIGGLMSKSQFTELGTAHSDSIRSAKQQAKWIEDNKILEGDNLARYNEVKETMGNVYDLTDDEKANLSVEDVARMYHEYYTNLFGQGGNRQEQNAVSQADFLNEITGEETTRRGLMGETATKYVDEFGIRPDNETLQSISDNQQVLSEEQVQEVLEQDEQETTGEAVEGEEKTGIVGKFTKGKINNKTPKQAKEEQAQNGGQVQQKKGGLKEKYGNWERIDEGEGYDYNYRASYRNTKTGRVARIDTVNGGYTITDITDKEEGTPTIAKTLKDVTKFLGKKANQKTKFMSDGTQEQVSQALPQEDGVIATKDITKDENGDQWSNGKKIQSNKAQTIHSMQDLHDYYKTHKDLMSKDLYAEISRQMMRFGIGNANNTEIVLDLTNREAGGFGSETTIRTDPNDENSAVTKAIVRLYAGADLATAAHEMAHLGWMNLSDQDRATFTKWAEKTQGEFIAKILGMDYDQNFRSYLIEALTNRESQTSQDLWEKIKREGAVQQTLGILNGQNYGLAVEERFAWEFSNWYAQGYIKGTKPRNIIERILNKACATLRGALNLLSDTNRYLNGENGYNGGDINSIFTNMSTRGIEQQRQTVTPQVELRTEMTQPIQESPYNLRQGVDETFEEGLYNSPQQNLGRNTGTVGAQTYETPQVEEKPEQDLSRNTGNVPKMARTEGVTRKPTKYTPPPTVDQRVEQMNRGLQNEYLDIDNSQTSPVYNNLAPSADEEFAMDVMKNADKTEGLEAMQKKEAAEREKAEKQARAEAEKQRKAREKEKRDKLNALNKDVKDKIATANKSLNAKKKQTSIEEMENQINEAEKALVNFENEKYTLRMIDNPNKQISPQDKKTFNEYYHAIDDMRKRLNDIKQAQEQNKSIEKVNLTSDNQNATMVENQEKQEVAESGETEDTRGTENLQGNVGEVQRGGAVRTGDDLRTGEGRIQQDSVERSSEENGKDIPLLKNSKFKSIYNAREEKKTEVKDWRDLSDSDQAKQVYVDALNASKEANKDYGVYVSEQTVESLKDCKVVLHKNKMAGFAITPDGNIVGVFSNPKNPIRGILNDMIFIAHMMGGNSMDCFGDFLLYGYRACGFTPVARTTFDETYYPADNPANNTIRKEKPDVFFLVKDNDNNTAYLNKMNKGEYKNDQIAIDNIPLIDSEDSYGDALGFQGQVLEEIQKKENKNKSTKEVADSLRPKEETATETQETPVQNSQVEQPIATKSEPVETESSTEQVQQASEETKKPKTRTFAGIRNKAVKDFGKNYIAREEALKNPDLSFARAYYDIVTTLEEGEGDYEELPLNQDGELSPSKTKAYFNKALTVLKYGADNGNPECNYWLAELASGEESPNIDMFDTVEEAIEERFEFSEEDIAQMYKVASDGGIKVAKSKLPDIDTQTEVVEETETETSPETKTATKAKPKTKKTTKTINEGNIENNEKTQPLTQQQNQTTIDKSDQDYQKAVELVIKNRGMSATGLRLTLKDEGIVVGQEKAEQYLVQMENDGIVEHGDEGSLRMLKKNPSTKMQEAGQNAENQTLLTQQVEEELENLFWKLIRKKQFHGMDSRWESGKLDYYRSLSNRRQGKEFNPEFIKGDKAFLNAIKNVNDYIHEKFPQYKNVYRGVDGHWRFEFSDKDAKFINGFEKLNGKTLDTTLDKILKHDNLYKFYSKLKGMPVHLVRNTKMQEIMEDTEHKYYAMYDPDEKAIYINSDMFESNDEVRNSLLHEIQHAIQDIEGFANGTNDNAYNNDYDFSEGEKQAVLTEKRSNMSDEELQQNPRSKTLNPNEKTIIQEQRPVQKVAKSPSTKMQSNGQNNLGYIDKEKDIYSVTFTKSAQQNAENKKKMDFYRKNKSYWRENKDAQSGSITFTRALPYQQHQKTIIYDEINGKKVGKRKKAKWREYYEAFKDHMIKWLFNDKHFLEKAARNVGAIESYMRMMVMKDQGAVAGAAIEDGIVKHNGKNSERTKSLNSIIEAVGEENQTDFLNYCEAWRVLDLEKRNIYQKMTPDNARKEIAKVKRSKNAKLFEQQRQNFVEYNHELLWVLVDGGFITEQRYNKFIENDPNFIPLAKNMDELEGYVDGFKDSKTMINVAHPMHKIGTSMREVANPFLEMQKRTVEYYVKASRNKAGHIFVHDIAEAIAQNAKGDVVAQNQGMVRKLASRDKNGKPISHDNKQYVFYVWENGEKQYYQVADREIYVALKSFDAEQMGALSKIMNATAGKASRLVRNTATMTPDFGLRNLVRDNMEAFISSEHGFLPLVDSLWGMYQMANDTQWFKEYQRMNGEHLSLNRDGEDVATVEHDIKDNVKFYKTIVPLFKKDLHEFMDKDRSMPARAKSLLKLVALDIVPLQSIYKANKRLNDYLETGTRIGEYRNARMGYKGLKGRLFETSGSTIWTTDMDLSRAKNTEMIAAYKSKDITLNFGQHGVLGKELNRYIPFFNASLQGIYKLGNTLDDMIHAEDARRRQELMFKCALMGAMGMAAALAGQGDDDYEEAPDYEHENFWILPNGIRIPKDQLFGKLIGGTVEKATAQYLKDGDVKKLELVQDILGNFAIDKCVPALVDLGWGTIGNYDSFKKKSVTPEYMADKLGYLQKDLSTSKAGADISETIYKVTDGLFKALGYNSGGVDIGAKKVDFVISKTLSNLGKYATSLWELTGGNEKMTRGAEVEDKGGFAETSKELPYPLNQIVGTFATNRNSFQSISDFYERHRELKKLSSDESIMSKNEKKAWEAYQAAYKKDKQYRDALKAIKLDKSLTGAQKRQKADKIFKQQISMARKLHDWEKKHGLV